MLNFYTGARDTKSDAHVCMSSTLSKESSSHPSKSSMSLHPTQYRINHNERVDVTGPATLTHPTSICLYILC